MSWKELLALFLWFTNVISPLESFKIGCQACHPLFEDKINVHLIPHSHDDAGWRQTFDQYYEGNGTNGTPGLDPSVRRIINSTVEALKANPDRRFIQVEISFFWKWWQEQTEQIRADVRELVKEGRLEIINGGWVMNDEATTNYQSIIDQFTWGFRILNETLGECATPKIGWQIDPFGHSEQHASILKQMGFLGLFLGRVDLRDKSTRISTQNLEFNWQTSENSTGDEGGLFTSIFPTFYTCEDEFCFDLVCSDFIKPANKADRVTKFAAILDGYKHYYKTNNILIPMGGDFHYQDATLNFMNIDYLLEGFVNHPTYNVLYSTPSCYVKAVQDELKRKAKKLNKQVGDFFPYADKNSAYWTGFFTSRPTFKRFARVGHAILQSAKQITTMSRMEEAEKDNLIKDLREVMGLLQHHDAITGTEKQTVAEDYVNMLTKAIHNIEKPMGVIIGNLLGKDPTAEMDLKVHTCLLRNISICDISTDQKAFYIAVYNPLARPVSHYVRLPVTGTCFQITGPEGAEVAYDVFDTINTFEYVKESLKPSTKELVFKASNISGLGIKLYYIVKLETADPGPDYHPYEPLTNATTFGSDSGPTFTIDDCGLTNIKIRNVTRNIKQEFLYYLGKTFGFQDERPSGAYIFNPEYNVRITLTNTKYAKGQLVDEVIQEFEEYVTQIIRVYKNQDNPHIEFDWLVGDLRVLMGGGAKEVITRFEIEGFQNNQTFFTDSNGREMIKRTLNQRDYFKGEFEKDPISSNYYPVTSKIAIVDESQQLEFAVLNDRAQGGSSLTEGRIELMVHRRLSEDEGLGVDEVLTEEEYGKGLYVRGKHYVTFGTLSNDSDSVRRWETQLETELLLEPWILLGNNPFLNSLDTLKQHLNFEFNGLKKLLPENINILTLEPWNQSYLLRLEHIYEKDKVPHLSSDVVNVDLWDLFSTFNVIQLDETYLGANQKKESDQKGITFTIRLRPFEIRTFLIKTNRNNLGQVTSNANGRLHFGFKIFVLLLIMYSVFYIKINCEPFWSILDLEEPFNFLISVISLSLLYYQ